jgi:hypothetical protein
MNAIASTRRSILAAGIVSLTALGAAFTTEAATITWGAATSIAGDADVSTTGTRVMAFNFGDPTVTGTTVNGVTFDPFALLTTDTQLSYTVGNATLSTADDRGPVGGTTGTFQALSAPYLTLLNSAAFLIADRRYSLTLSGLTVGQEYEFQVWSNNSGRDFFGSYGDFPTSVSDTDGNGVDLFPGDSNPAAPGEFAIGTFIADNTSQVFRLGSGEISGVINGFQLRQVAPVAPPVSPIPEPGSALVGLLVLGLCGLGSARRVR